MSADHAVVVQRDRVVIVAAVREDRLFTQASKLNLRFSDYFWDDLFLSGLLIILGKRCEVMVMATCMPELVGRRCKNQLATKLWPVPNFNSNMRRFANYYSCEF